MAIEHANTILDWQENLTDDEIPPEWMWSLTHELIPWFDRVRQEREDRFGGGGSGRDETTPMMQNELSRRSA